MTQTNSRSIHTTPGIIVALPNWTLQELQGTASCPIPLPLTFIWGRGPADGVIGSLGKQSIPAQLSSWDGTAEAYRAGPCSLKEHIAFCVRGTERGLSTRLQLVAQWTFQEVSFVHESPRAHCSMPDPSPTTCSLGSKYARHSRLGNWIWLCLVPTIRQGRNLYVPSTLCSVGWDHLKLPYLLSSKVTRPRPPCRQNRGMQGVYCCRKSKRIRMYI